MDKSNYTVLGFVALYIPLFLSAVIATIMIHIMFAVMMILVAPFIFTEEGLEKLDKRYNLSAKIETGLCKLGTSFKLIKRC